MPVITYYMGTTTLVEHEENQQTISTNAIPSSTEDTQAMLAQVYAAVKEEEKCNLCY